jgi:hypothetical protein
LLKAFLKAADGFPIMAPELVLLYTASDPGGRDETNRTDFLAVRGRLNPEQRDWLRTALEALCPNHAWLCSL